MRVAWTHAANNEARDLQQLETLRLTLQRIRLYAPAVQEVGGTFTPEFASIAKTALADSVAAIAHRELRLPDLLEVASVNQRGAAQPPEVAVGST